ncbi:hypothetical protein NKH77_48610 [Streptomyces sp. M19]
MECVGLIVPLSSLATVILVARKFLKESRERGGRRSICCWWAAWRCACGRTR